MPPEAHLTNQQVLICTGILILVDSLLVFLTSRLISRMQFQHMRRGLILASGLFYFVLWSSVMWWGWDWFYRYIFPGWARFCLPIFFGPAYALLSSGMFWMSLRLSNNPALVWSVLGGIEGLISHIYAIFGLGAATKPPIMEGTNPYAVLTFAIFEKSFYWSQILLFCWLVSGVFHLTTRSMVIDKKPG